MYGRRLVPVSLFECCNTYCVDILHLRSSYNNTMSVKQSDLMIITWIY